MRVFMGASLTLICTTRCVLLGIQPSLEREPIKWDHEKISNDLYTQPSVFVIEPYIPGQPLLTKIENESNQTKI